LAKDRAISALVTLDSGVRDPVGFSSRNFLQEVAVTRKPAIHNRLMNDFMICWFCGLEGKTDAHIHDPGMRIREEVLVLRQLTAEGEDLRIVAGVVRDQEQVLRAHIEAQALDLPTVGEGGGQRISQ